MSRKLLRRAVWRDTFFLLVAYFLLIVIAFRLLENAALPTWLKIVLAFGLAQFWGIGLLLTYALARKALAQIQERRWQRVAPAIRTEIAAYLARSGEIVELARLNRRHPSEVASCLDEFLASLAGEGRESVERLVLALGLLERWRRNAHARNPRTRRQAILRLTSMRPELVNDILIAALEDSDEDVRLAASRVLSRSADPGTLRQVVRAAAGQSLMHRALLVEELRPQTHRLDEATLGELLVGSDAAEVTAILEMVQAWGRMMSLPSVIALLSDPRAAVRAAALRTAPYVAEGVGASREILSALEARVPEVQLAAVETVGRMRMSSAVASLAKLLESPDAPLRIASAHALAHLAAPGLERLEAATMQAHPDAAAAALEAIEVLKLGRMEIRV
jgi:HEAT repeat protein